MCFFKYCPVISLFLLISTNQTALAETMTTWEAGAAKIVITPSEPVWMAGYAGRNGPSEGVLVDLHARALGLKSKENNRLFLVTLDLIEIPESLRKLILDVANEHGIKPEELLLNVSHTHGGPMLSAANIASWGIDPIWGERADAYAREVAEKVGLILGKVIANQTPCQIRYSHARCGFAMNRRQHTPGGFRLGQNPDGPVDHDVPLLSVNAMDGRLVGLVFGYACHNTALGPTLMINGDYAGFASQKLEKDHPDTVCLFLAGCGGDQDPAPRRNQEDARQNGDSLALAVEAALLAPSETLQNELSASMEFCPLPFAPLPPKAYWEDRAKSGNGFVSRHAQSVLKQWAGSGAHPPDYQLPIQVIILGQKLTLVALGGEPMADYALRLKKELAKNNQPVWVAGYSNLVNAYVPTRRVLLEGGYEGTEAVIYQSLPGPFKNSIEELIVESVHRQVERIRKNPPKK